MIDGLLEVISSQKGLFNEKRKHKTYSSAIPFSTRFGGVPVKVAIPPTLAANATDRARALASRWISSVLFDKESRWSIVTWDEAVLT